MVLIGVVAALELGLIVYLGTTGEVSEAEKRGITWVGTYMKLMLGGVPLFAGIAIVYGYVRTRSINNWVSSYTILFGYSIITTQHDMRPCTDALSRSTSFGLGTVGGRVREGGGGRALVATHRAFHTTLARVCVSP